ncbi:zf-HC2 domain-containing protein [Promicromonospora sp. NPDC059942]|uniref:zf-HC2 domain-containing protein n=1 Tax=Promicromonospora sp. NPDC059942 TaxID=3347009 RepID=UPI00365E861C
MNGADWGGPGRSGPGGNGPGGSGSGRSGDRCAELRDALTEVALGVADGATRAAVMTHLATCDRCRDELSSLADAADEVLLLVPEHEPPADFEGRVLARLAGDPARPDAGPTSRAPGAPVEPGALDGPPAVAGAGPTAPGRSTRGPASSGPATVRRHGARRAVLAAALGAGLLVAGGASVWVVTAPDRELAASYRTTLDTAHGRYLTAADLVADDSADGTAGDSAAGSVGTVFLYEGDPSWAYVVVRDAGPAASYDVTAVVANTENTGDPDAVVPTPYGRGVHATEPGHTTFDRRASEAGTPPGTGNPGNTNNNPRSDDTREISLGSCVVTTGTCSAGGVLGVPVRDVVSVRLTTQDGTPWATATP